MIARATLAVMTCIFTTEVLADWYVSDRTSQEKLDRIIDHTSSTASQAENVNAVLGTTSNGDGKPINANLDAINKKLKIGQYVKTQPGSRVADPTDALPPDSTKLDDGARCTSVAEAQRENCRRIVDLENAQYQYMLTMYSNTRTRDDMLRLLLEERSEIKTDDPNEFGKLVDNTNKLTALHSLIALDQQRMLAANHAYEANLRFLRAQQTLAANAAASGKKPAAPEESEQLAGGEVDFGNAVGGLLTGFVLKQALREVKTSRPNGMQTLSIGKSNGF